jgi:3-hydroxyisobutyrate dehydrogenase-like beta-hydroxyacid dehydrogenase
MKIGFIGVGNMGGPMCRNIIRKSGHTVAVYDRDAAAVQRCVEGGGVAADSLREAVADSDVVITSLPTPKLVEAVAIGEGGIVEHIRRGAIYIDLSTCSPTVMRGIGERMAAAGVRMLEAPVSGGVPGAEAGTIAIMVGGEQAVYQECEALFASFSARTIHMGDIGAGSIAKLVNNMVCLATMAVCAEGLMIAASTGVSLDRLDEVIKSSSGDSFSYRALTRKVSQRDFSPNFSLDLAYKDMGLADDLATEHGVPTPMLSQTIALMRMARGMGMGGEDCSALIRAFERPMGIEAVWPAA